MDLVDDSRTLKLYVDNERKIEKYGMKYKMG